MTHPLLMITRIPRPLLLCAVLASVAGCGGGSDGTGSETTTSTDTTGTSTDTSTSTGPGESSSSSSSDTGPDTPSCPFYSYAQPPEGNVDTPYEFIPAPTSEPDFWAVEYTAEVPGLTFGPMISGIPEQEGRYEVALVLSGPGGGVCQPEMRTLVIGPPLPADSSGSDDSSGTDSSGTDSSTTAA